MAVTRARFARSVTYSPHDTQGQSSQQRLVDFQQDHSTNLFRKKSIRDRLRLKPTEFHSSADPEPHRLECAQCEVEMEVLHSKTRNLYYLICPKCRAKFASSYEEVLAARASVKPRVLSERARSSNNDRWRNLKERADAFHRRVDESDPYQVLGLRVGTPFEQVRAHYHELAVRYHPDRGGDPAKMRGMIDAYQRIRSIYLKQRP